VPAQLGVTGYTTVGASDLNGFATTAPLGIVISCNGQNYLAGGGVLFAVPSALGMASTTLTSATCALMNTSGQAVTGAAFLRLPSSGQIYYIAGGKKQLMTSMAKVYELNGSNPLVLIPTTQAVLTLFVSGPNLG
jgi:hypothetical protein